MIIPEAPDLKVLIFRFFFQIRFSAKVEPYENITFQLKYEEKLKRISLTGANNGPYKYKLNFYLKNQIVDDFKIKIAIDETLPLKNDTIKANMITDVQNEVISTAPEITRAKIQRSSQINNYFL